MFQPLTNDLAVGGGAKWYVAVGMPLVADRHAAKGPGVRERQLDQARVSKNLRRLASRIYNGLPLKRPLFDLLRPLGLPKRLYQHLHFSGDFDVPLHDGRRFRVRSYGDQVENDLFWAGYGKGFEAQSLRVWAALAQTSEAAILDIGANTGLFALAARALAGPVPVVAFEPVTRIAERLATNVLLNNFDVEVTNLAVSDKSGSAIMHDTDDMKHSYSASLETGFKGNDFSFTVQTTTLDEWLTVQSFAVSLIKIDVEMHEPAAIRGMLGTLERYRPALVIEILTPALGTDVGALLGRFGYRYFMIDERRGLVPVETLGFREGEGRNVLACTDERFARAGLATFTTRSPHAIHPI